MNKNEIMKKVGSIVIASTIAITPTLTLAKENNYTKSNITQTKKDDEIKVYYNGEKIEFDQKPVLINDRTLVPFRKVFETMGCIVYYNNNEGKVMALTGKGDILIHTIGSNEFEFNKEVMTFDSASTILNDRTLIPLRAVAEILNSKVDWDEKTNTVTIEKEEEKLEVLEKEIINHVLDKNYNPKDTKRYIEYKRLHPEKTIEEVIIDVNMDMDKELALITINSPGPDITYNGYSHYGAKEEDIEEITDLGSMTSLVNQFNAIPLDYEPDDLVNVSYRYVKEGTPIDPETGKPLYIGNFHFSDKFLRSEAESQWGLLLDKYVQEGNYILNIETTTTYLNAKDAECDFNAFRQLAWQRIPQDKLEIYAYGTGDEARFSQYRNGLTVNLPYSHPQGMIVYNLKTYGKCINEAQQQEYELMKGFYEYDMNVTYPWVKENGYKYGFIERYPADKTHITRKFHQPWLFRYVGVEVAKQMHDENLCLEEYHAKFLNPTVHEYQYSIESETTQKVLQKIAK